VEGGRSFGFGCWWSETADPSASLGMTKERVDLQSGFGCTDPRSQTRDLGHPSVHPLDAGRTLGLDAGAVADVGSFVISLSTRVSESAARDDKGEGGVSTWHSDSGVRV
jgi:hypothetical protein